MTDPLRGAACGKCQFFLPTKKADRGECRAIPPHARQSVGTAKDHAVWPIVRSDQWCGAFRPRQADSP